LSNVPSGATLSQASLLSVNTTLADVDPTNNRRVIGITIANTGTANIVLSQMSVSWTGVAGSTRLTGITINGGSVWTGNNNSGATQNITDFTLSPSTTYPLTYLIFNRNITSITLSINFIMADGSTKLISNIRP